MAVIKNRLKAQTFNDGTAKIYKLENVAPKGEQPKTALTQKHHLPYKQRTVGIQRHYTALQHQSKIKHLLRCPRLADVLVEDIAIPNDGVQYKISLIQYPEDIYPPVMDLTLEVTKSSYEITR